MLIAIPSKGRAGEVASVKVLPSATLFVPQNETGDYQRFGYQGVIGVPNEIKGITKTRNWILKNAKDERVVFVDDDVKVQGWIELHHENAIHHKLDERAWLVEFVKLFGITEDLGFKIWGVSTDGALRSVYPWRPFIFHTYVTASCMGIINHGLFFDESFPVKEDYELCLRCIKNDGGILGARYLYWVNEHWSGNGGCSDYRTQAMERETTNRLIKMYPGMIRRVVRGGSEFSIDLNF